MVAPAALGKQVDVLKQQALQVDIASLQIQFAGRMTDVGNADDQSQGGSLIMIAKGNRGQQVTDACHKHGGFYLGSIGGPAAILAQNSIKSLECLEYPELGMEAIWKIEVVDFPAFILVDDKGNDFFQQLKPVNCATC